MRFLAVALLVWLVIGAIAADQRGEFSSAKRSCSSASTIAVTILAGPLNYAGVNPRTRCSVRRSG